MNTDDENKDYIINLRVSRATYEKIKEKAKENRESISNLVRKAIEDSSEIISDLSGEIFGTKKSERTDIASYHRVKAAKDIVCDTCRTKIPTGQTATVGETTGAKKYFFCENCK